MAKAQQKQGHDFEKAVSTALHDLRRQGSLRMVYKFANRMAQPADFLVFGQRKTYLIECKSLIEGKSGNKDYSLRLSCFTQNEWAGMEVCRGANREYWVVWMMTMLDGERYVYAAPGWLLLQARRSGVKHLSVDAGGVQVVGSNGDLDVWKMLAGREALDERVG